MPPYARRAAPSRFVPTAHSDRRRVVWMTAGVPRARVDRHLVQLCQADPEVLRAFSLSHAPSLVTFSRSFVQVRWGRTGAEHAAPVSHMADALLAHPNALVRATGGTRALRSGRGRCDARGPVPAPAAGEFPPALAPTRPRGRAGTLTSCVRERLTVGSRASQQSSGQPLQEVRKQLLDSLATEHGLPSLRIFLTAFVGTLRTAAAASMAPVDAA